MCQLIREAIEEILGKINNAAFRQNTVLSRYLLMYLVRRVLDAEEFGRQADSQSTRLCGTWIAATRNKFRTLVGLEYYKTL